MKTSKRPYFIRNMLLDTIGLFAVVALVIFALYTLQMTLIEQINTALSQMH